MKDRFCPNCGYKLPLSENRMTGEMSYPKGFIEVYFAKDGYDDRDTLHPDAGYIKIYFDNDMAWMIPVKDAKSPRQVLYKCLSDFLNTETDPDTAITLYINDVYLDNKMSGRGPVYPEDKRYWESLKRILARRPYIMLSTTSTKLLTEKLKFLKARFAKGQKGKKLPNIKRR